MIRSNRPMTARRFSLLVFAFLLLTFPRFGYGVTLRKMANFAPDPSALSRKDATLGTVADRLIVMGGTDRDGNRIDAILIGERSANGESWRESDVKLPESTGSITSFSVKDGIVLLSGDRLWRFGWDKERNDLTIAELPPLPVDGTGFSGGVRESTLYLAGVDGTGAPLVLQLDLSSEGTDRWGWDSLPPYPGPGRKFAAATVQNVSSGKAFFLFGGIDATTGERLTDGLAFHFDKKAWEPVENADRLPFDFARWSALPSGSIHLVLIDAVSENPADLSRGTEIWGFNTITRKLFPLGGIPDGSVPDGAPVLWNGHVAIPTAKMVISPTGGESEPVGNADAETSEKDAVDAGVPSVKEPDGISLLTLEDKTNRLSRLNQIIIAAYFVFLTAASLYFMRRMRGTDDYFRGGCRVPWWALGISIYGTITSAITYITVPAKSFMTDWSYFLLALGPFIAVPFLIYFYIPKISRFNFTSAYEYLEYRFHFMIRIFGSVVFIVFQILRIAILLFLPSIALNAITGIDIYHCILWVGIAGVFCTLLGGIEIVIWIEVFQVIILLIGFALALVVAVVRSGIPFTEMIQVAYQDGKFHCVDPSFNFHIPSVWVMVLASVFLYFIPYASDQTILQRYFAGKDIQTRTRGVWISLVLTVPNLVLLFLAGTLFYVFFKEHPRELLVTMSNNDSLMPWFFVSQLPNGLSGFLLLALFTSAMSSVSSGINAISATYTIDVHERIFHFSREKALHAARVITVLSGACGILIALAMATWDIASLWDQYNLFIGLVSSSLAGIFFLGVFFKRANTPGVLIGLVASVIVQYTAVKTSAVHLLLYSGTGLITMIVVGALASLFFPTKVLVDPTVAGSTSPSSPNGE